MYPLNISTLLIKNDETSPIDTHPHQYAALERPITFKFYLNFYSFSLNISIRIHTKGTIGGMKK